MPKDIKTILAFDGGLVDFSDPRDIDEKQAKQLLNLSPRFVGRLKQLGSSIKENTATTDGTKVVDIPAGDDIGLNPNAIYFVYSTDRSFSNTVSPTDYIATVDATTGAVYIFHSSGTATWVTNGDTGFFDTNAIDGKIGTLTSDTEPGYYFVDGVLRIANTNSAQGYTAPHATNGCTSLWIGHIERNYLTPTTVEQDGTGGSIQATPNNTFIYGAPILKPTTDTFKDISGLSSFESSQTTTPPTLSTIGTFACKIMFERDKGDGTIKMVGRRFYITYTYDNSQESLPMQIGTVGASNLPIALNSTELGYDATAKVLTEYGAAEIKLERDVRVQQTMDSDDSGGIDNASYKNWDNAGTVTATDTNGQTQTLSYSNIVDEAYEINTIAKDGGDWTVETDIAHSIEATDVVYIVGGASGDNITEANRVDVATVGVPNNTSLTFSSGSATQGATASTGRIIVHNKCKLTGITGWVDTGYCNKENVIEALMVGAGGSGYTNDSYPLNAGSPPLSFSPAITGIEGSLNVVGNSISDITITNHGSSVAVGTTVTVTVNDANIGSGSGGSVSADMSGALTNESLCTTMNGTWSSADLDDGVTVTYDPPGEIDETDENLGFKILLTAAPFTADSIVSPLYGGNRLTHINFYTDKYENDDADAVAESGDMAYVTSFDLVKGWKNDSGVYEGDGLWTKDATLENQANVRSGWFGSIFSDNFQGRTGMFADTLSTDIRWKTATVLNRRVYAGNVIMTTSIDTTGAKVEKKFEDRICKSLPNQFDNFPEYDILDVVVDDGDEIIHLENFGGKLLQFKRKSLYIIDVTSEPEFLAGSFKYRGIANSAAAKKTDFGVIFANKYGAFIYNNEGTQSLTQSKIEDEWEAWYTEDVAVGFIAEDNCAIFKKSGSSDFLYYDLPTGSWAKGNGNRMLGTATSDFFDYRGNILYASKHGSNQIEFYKWSDSPDGTLLDSSDNCIYESKEFAFDTPVTDTRVYNVKITYKTTSGQNPNMHIKLERFNGSQYNTVDLGELTGTLSTWQTQEFSVPSDNRICKTARILLTQKTSNQPDIGFEVNDIAIVYRSRRVK